jgi:Domain of Unknown Function (DUF1259)
MISMRTSTSRAVVGMTAIAAAAVLVLAAGCSSGSKGGSVAGNEPGSGPRSPVTRTEADWKPVADALGRTGKLGDNNTAYETPLMGDLVVTETEVPKVTDALQAHGIAQTALHRHLLQQSPPVWWTHIHGVGDATELAQGLKAALDATSMGPAFPPPAQQPPVDIDVVGVQQALGRKGTADGGLLKYNICAQGPLVEDGHVLPAASLNLTTVVNFQSVGTGRAAINGDFILTDPEVQTVIQAPRGGNIQIVELHNHGLTEQPRLFYMHFWAVDDAVSVARALRPALDATNLQPA